MKNGEKKLNFVMALCTFMRDQPPGASEVRGSRSPGPSSRPVDAVAKRKRVLDIYRDLGASAEIENDAAAAADLRREVFIKRSFAHRAADGEEEAGRRPAGPAAAAREAGRRGRGSGRHTLTTTTLNRFAALDLLDGGAAVAVDADPEQRASVPASAPAHASKPAAEEKPYERPASTGGLLLEDDDLGEDRGGGGGRGRGRGTPALGYHFIDGFLEDLGVYLEACGGRGGKRRRPVWDDLDETRKVLDELYRETSLKGFLWSI
ncbi:hypothetical protein LZ31DRAFT_635642 [Colletotrichum somersetense]|nr:hypothetical protein LZ31DRAFT_635642 [Colletotrichum somersetense]